MIPKTINYCWFGRGAKPTNFDNIIASWHRFCPEYDIIEWNEKNYDVNKNTFTKYAYSVGKYAFVSDYARLDIINRVGGVYVDVDVEFLKPLDSIIQNGPFFATEEIDKINTGLIFACGKSDPILNDLMRIYSQMDLDESKQSIDYSNTVEIVSKYFRRHGYCFNGKRQMIKNHTIYETSVFCPQQFGEEANDKRINKAFTTHHYNSSWVSEDKLSLDAQYRHARVARRIKRYLGVKVYDFIYRIYAPLFGRGKQ